MEHEEVVKEKEECEYSQQIKYDRIKYEPQRKHCQTSPCALLFYTYDSSSDPIQLLKFQSKMSRNMTTPTK